MTTFEDSFRKVKKNEVSKGVKMGLMGLRTNGTNGTNGTH